VHYGDGFAPHASAVRAAQVAVSTVDRAYDVVADVAATVC
jgi:hypothetical protein